MKERQIRRKKQQRKKRSKIRGISNLLSFQPSLFFPYPKKTKEKQNKTMTTTWKKKQTKKRRNNEENYELAFSDTRPMLP